MKIVLMMSFVGAGVACGSVSTNKSDAGVDTPTVDIDAPDARAVACGDGFRDPGEVCYGQPIVLVANDVTFDAHFGDEDGDGDLDIIYLIGDQYKFFPQQGGQFASSALDGPTTFSEYARSRDLGGTSRVELIDAGGSGISTWRRNAGNTDYELINTAAAPANTELRAFAMGFVTGSATPNPVAVYTSSLVVGTYDGNLTLTAPVETSVQGTMRSMDIAHADADTFEDVLLAGTNGVVLYRGTASGVQSVTLTGQTTSTDAAAFGDIDDDNINDIAFAISGASGQVGVMRGAGGAAYLGATTKTVANLGNQLTTADIDGDGKLDVIAERAQTGANAVLVLLGRADGTLADPVPLPVSALIDYLRCDADFNGDGAPDCVTTDRNNQNIIIVPSDV